MMKRPYTKNYDILLDFRESGELVTEVDTLQWTSDKMAVDSLRRTIRQKGFKVLVILQRGENIYLLNYAAIKKQSRKERKNTK